MTRMELRRKAPEAQSTETCSICGGRQSPGPRDHLLVGTPGVPSHDGAVCEGCGSVLEHVVDRFGGDLSMSVQQVKRHTDGAEATGPRPPDRPVEQAAPAPKQSGAVVLLRDASRAEEALAALERAGFSGADATLFRPGPWPSREA